MNVNIGPDLGGLPSLKKKKKTKDKPWQELGEDLSVCVMNILLKVSNFQV